MNLGKHADMRVLGDPEYRRDCARELFFTRNGGATIENEKAWDALSDTARADFERDAVGIQREHSKTLTHLPVPESMGGNGMLLISG